MMGALSLLCNRETNREPSYQAPPLVAWNTLSHLSILVTAPVHILPTLPGSTTLPVSVHILLTLPVPVSTHDLQLHTEGVHILQLYTFLATVYSLSTFLQQRTSCSLLVTEHILPIFYTIQCTTLIFCRSTNSAQNFLQLFTVHRNYL